MPARKVGRPPKYKCKEEIEGLIEEYFTRCQGEVLKDENDEMVYDKYGRPIIVNQRPPTVTGLALALGFTTRLSLLNYQGKKEFMNTITRAKTYIESYAEERLYDREGVQGAKFNLINNFKGWTERPKEDTEKETLEKLDELLEGINRAAKS